MADEWIEVPIGEIAEVFDGPHATPAKTESGPIFLGISNLDRGRLNLAQTEHLSEDDWKRWTRRVSPSPGDVVFSYETRIGEAALIPEDLKCCLGRRMGLLRARPGKVDPRFLLYAYLGQQFQEVLRSRTVHGSTVDRIPLIEMSAFPILVPKRPAVQRAIACILGSLDDKIELNRRMNRTLEEMARAIFKSWFIDFDPVRAKAAVRRQHPKWTDDQVSRAACPKLKPEIARLFPDSFEDSELGEIPKGWRVGCFGDVVKQLRDQENPLLSPGVLFHHFSIPAFDDGQSPKLECGENIRSTKFLVPQNAILLSKLNPEIPRVWMVDVQPGDRAICSTEFLVLCAVFPFTGSFVYCLALSPLFRQQIEGLVTGTSKSHQRAEVSSILKVAVILPPASVVQAFTRMADNLLARTLECRRESRTLAALRDALLPKLISGELRVPDAERIAARCA